MSNYLEHGKCRIFSEVEKIVVTEVEYILDIMRNHEVDTQPIVDTFDVNNVIISIKCWYWVTLIMLNNYLDTVQLNCQAKSPMKKNPNSINIKNC